MDHPDGISFARPDGRSNEERLADIAERQGVLRREEVDQVRDIVASAHAARQSCGSAHAELPPVSQGL